MERELAAMRGLRAASGIAAMEEQFVPAGDLLQLAGAAARGRLAYARRDFEGAARHYRAAVAIEDTIPYMKPPYWYYPVRQSLGAALLRDGKASQAQQLFMEALARAPGNGWTLFGLAQSQRALGDPAGERATRAALERAWLGDPDWLRVERL